MLLANEEISDYTREAAQQAREILDGMLSLIDDWPSEGWNTPAVDSSYRQALIPGVTSGHFLRKASGSNA